MEVRHAADDGIAIVSLCFFPTMSEGRNGGVLVYKIQLFCKEIYSVSAEEGVRDMQTGVKHEVIIEAQISS